MKTLPATTFVAAVLAMSALAQKPRIAPVREDVGFIKFHNVRLPPARKQAHSPHTRVAGRPIYFGFCTLQLISSLSAAVAPVPTCYCPAPPKKLS